MASFKKLGTDNWQVSFYCKDYLGNNKKYKKSGFRTKSLANEYANDFIAKMSGSSEVMLFTAVETYLDYMKDKVKLSTNNSKRVAYNALKRVAGNIQLNKIDARYISITYEALKDTPAIQKDVKKLLGGTFEYAKVHFGITHNIAREVKITRINYNDREEKVKEIWTLNEFNEFISKLFQSNLTKLPKYVLIYNLLYFTGMRPGELSALTLNDIDLENKTIRVNKTRLNQTMVNSPKTKSSNRVIKIHNGLVNMLQKYIETLPKIKTEFIFPAPSTLKSMLNIHLKFTGVKKISLHSFRHSHASFLVANGIDIVTISNRLGHSNAYITLSVYSHLYKDKDDSVINILESL